MSIRALSWAFALDLRPSSLKFLLVAMADAADDRGLLFPSLAHLVEKTNQDRKTVQAGVADLIERGLVEDTGARIGRTGSIRVLQIVAFKPESHPKNGTASKDESHPETGIALSNSSDPENGTATSEAVPFSDGSGPVFPPKRSQKRDTEPSGTVRNQERERAREDVPRESPEPEPNWRSVEGVNHDALLTWSTFSTEQGRVLTPLQLRETAIALAAMGDGPAQRAAVSFSIAGGFKSIRQNDAANREAQQAAADRQRIEEGQRGRSAAAAAELSDMNARAERVGVKRYTPPDNFQLWRSKVLAAERAVRGAAH